MFAATEAIPFTVAVSEFAKEESTFDVIDVVVAATPFTVEVITLPEVVARFVVEEAKKLASDVDEVTPLTVEVMTLVDVAKLIVLSLIIVVVAETPLMVVVRILFERLCVNELTMFATVDVIPFTIVVKIFADDVATFDVMRLVVATILFTVEVKIFPDVVAELVVADVIVVVVAMVIRPCASIVMTGTSEVFPYVPAVTPVLESPMVVVPPNDTVPPPTIPVLVASVNAAFTKLAFEIELLGRERFPVTARFVVVALSAKRSVKNPERDLTTEEKKFVDVAFVATKSSVVIVPVAVISSVEVAIEYTVVVVPSAPAGPAGPVAPTPVLPPVVPSPSQIGNVPSPEVISRPEAPGSPASPFSP